MRKVGTDGYRIHHQATLKKVVSDRRASLDEETEIKPAHRKLVETEFKAGATLPVVFFPEESTAVQDSPRLTLIVLDPDDEWTNRGQAVECISGWTTHRGDSPRLYPGSLVWCARKQGRELRRKVETWLAWQRVSRELTEGVLGEEYDRRQRSEVHGQVRDAHEVAKDEVWASYRYLTLADTQERHGLKVIDLGAGHASAGETLCGRIISVLKAEALLNESVGAGYLDRNWPPALKEAGEWPLMTSLRQSFLNGALTRLIDPDAVLRRQIVSFVSSGDFGFASGRREDGGYDRLWFAELLAPEEVAFETNVFLLSKAKAEQLKAMPETPSELQPGPAPSPGPEPETGAGPRLRPDPEPTPPASETTLRLSGTVPSEVWNRIGIKLLPKLRSAKELTTSVEILATVDARSAGNIVEDVKQILNDLGLADRVRVQEHGEER